MDENQSARTKDQNMQKAVTALDAKFGSRTATNQAVSKKAEELGVTVEFLKDMAKTSPDGFLKVMKVGSTEPTGGGIPSDVNSSLIEKHAPNKPATPGTYRYYQELRRTDPAAYRRVEAQAMAEVLADPDKFYERT